jgi:predicted RNase H-like HicB family nuclease
MLNIRVLGYKGRDGQWAAHCLETDLVGYGKTFELALANLEELTEMQVSFAFYKKQPSLLDRPAPPYVFETYNILWRTYLQRYTEREKLLDKTHKLANIPLPSHLQKAGHWRHFDAI